MEGPEGTRLRIAVTRPARERIMLGYYVVVAVAAVALLVWSAGQPHSAATNEEEASPTTPAVTPAPGQLTAHFPPA